MDNLNNQENQEPIQPVKEGIEPSQHEGSTHMDHSAHMDHAPDMEHTSQSIAHEDHGAHAEKSEHDEHAGHQDHGAHVDHTGHEAMFRRKFWISLALSIPVLVFSPTIQAWLGWMQPSLCQLLILNSRMTPTIGC